MVPGGVVDDQWVQRVVAEVGELLGGHVRKRLQELPSLLSAAGEQT